MSESGGTGSGARDPVTVGFVGTGTMGAPIAAQLMAGGYAVQAFDPAAAALERVVAAGASACASPADAAAGVAAVFLSLPGPPEVVAAVTGHDGVLSADPGPRVIVDLSTNSPATVRRLHEQCAEHGTAFIDAPVSGGRIKAESGTLSVLVGATDDEFESLRPLLACFGADLILVGGSGAGTAAKLVNNQLFLAGAALVQEAYLLGAAVGLTPSQLHPILKASSAAPYTALAPLLLGRAFDDVIFRLDIAAKDLSLANEAAAEVGADLPVSAAAAELYRAAAEAGFGAEAFHATLKELERRSGVEVPMLTRQPRS